MKDVISILQSRIAKRENEIAHAETVCNRNSCYRWNVMQQKEDKRILAEIIKLRRVAKVVKRQEAIMRALDSVYEPAEIELPKDFVELIRLGER